MRKAYFLVLVVLLSGTMCWGAKHSNEFVLGAYTNMRNTFAFHRPNREIVASYLQELGYNSTYAETDSADNDLSTMLGILDDHGIDAILWDRSWSNDPSDLRHYAIGTLSSGHYVKLEAEFANEQDVVSGDRFESTYWYASRNDEDPPRIGRVVTDPDASYGHSWLVEKSMGAGVVYGDISFRWKNKAGAYSRYGTIWYVHQTNPPNFEGQFVSLRFRLKIDNIQTGLPLDAPLLTISAQGHPLVRSSFAREALTVNHRNESGSINGSTVLRLSELKDTGDESGYITLEIKVAYKDLLDSGLLTMDLDNNPNTSPSATSMKLINLYPKLYTHGNCDVYLDWVEMEDQIHYDFRSNYSSYQQGILNRLNQLISQSRGNIAFLYTHDEPFQSQFDSYRMLEDALKDTDKGLITAVYDYMYRHLVMDEDLQLYYDHLYNFRNNTQPDNLAPDIYPITPDTEWNSEDDEFFVQKLFDEKLHEAYLGSKLYAQNSFEIRFIPVVQSFGRWANVEDKKQWTKWVLPPYATQKALNYIPLCYGVDGVYHYRFQSYQDSQGLGDHSTMTVLRTGNSYGLPYKNPITWQAFEASNPKVKLYGSILKRYNWLGTQTLMGSNPQLLNGMNRAGITDITISSSDNEPYHGYVQMALYEDESRAVSLYLVNRRANYFQPGLYQEAKFVAQEDYEASFPQASPQRVTITANVDILRQYGNFVAMYDPATETYYGFEDGKVSIMMDAGEAVLLHLVGYIPESMRGRNNISSFAEVRGNCSLDARARLTIEEGATLILMPGARLSIPPRAKLIVKGEIVLMPGAAIEPMSRVDMKRNATLTDFNQQAHY